MSQSARDVCSAFSSTCAQQSISVNGIALTTQPRSFQRQLARGVVCNSTRLSCINDRVKAAVTDRWSDRRSGVLTKGCLREVAGWTPTSTASERQGATETMTRLLGEKAAEKGASPADNCQGQRLLTVELQVQGLHSDAVNDAITPLRAD